MPEHWTRWTAFWMGVIVGFEALFSILILTGVRL